MLTWLKKSTTGGVSIDGGVRSGRAEYWLCWHVVGVQQRKITSRADNSARFDSLTVNSNPLLEILALRQLNSGAEVSRALGVSASFICQLTGISWTYKSLLGILLELPLLGTLGDLLGLECWASQYRCAEAIVGDCVSPVRVDTGPACIDAMHRARRASMLA
jgi:hypothetical protein